MIVGTKQEKINKVKSHESIEVIQENEKHSEELEDQTNYEPIDYKKVVLGQVLNYEHLIVKVVVELKIGELQKRVVHLKEIVKR